MFRWLRRLFRPRDGSHWMPLDEAVRRIAKQRGCTEAEALRVLLEVAGPDKVRVIDEDTSTGPRP